LRHVTYEYNEAVDTRCEQGWDSDVLPPHGDHLIWLLFGGPALLGLCQTAMRVHSVMKAGDRV